MKSKIVYKTKKIPAIKVILNQTIKFIEIADTKENRISLKEKLTYLETTIKELNKIIYSN
jgi:hypothetical protein